MNDDTTPPLDRAARLRRLRFRAWHRGMQEVDLVLGRFIDAEGDALSDSEIEDFEALLSVPDREVLAWTTGEAAVPDEADTPLLRRILARHSLRSPT